jgi:hypothetical protein
LVLLQQGCGFPTIHGWRFGTEQRRFNNPFLSLFSLTDKTKILWQKHGLLPVRPVALEKNW